MELELQQDMIDGLVCTIEGLNITKDEMIVHIFIQQDFAEFFIMTCNRSDVPPRVVRVKVVNT